MYIRAREGGQVKEGATEMKEGLSWCPAAFSIAVFVVVLSDVLLVTGQRCSSPTLVPFSLMRVRVPPF